jgi:hypothetical protein
MKSRRVPSCNRERKHLKKIVNNLSGTSRGFKERRGVKKKREKREK